MLLYILFFSMIIVLISSWFIFKKDIIQPSIILTMSYVLSIFCVLLNINKWGVNLSNKAFWIILLGTLEFIAVSYIINLIFKKKNKNNIGQTEEKVPKTSFKISKKVTVMIIIYNVTIIALLIYYVLQIAGKYGNYSNFSEALTLYKSHTSYANDIQVPDYLTVIMKPIIASAYVYTFFYIKKIVYTEEKKIKIALKNWYYLIPAITYFAQRFTESNRGSIVNFILSAVVMYFIVYGIKNNWNKPIKLKTLVGLSLSGVICLVIFYFSASLVGRINTKGLVDYITCYCGGSIECFNLYTQEEDSIRVIRGEETFASSMHNLQKLKIIDSNLVIKNKAPFRYYKDNMIGNVYTSYKRWQHDFGIPGIIVLQAGLAIIFSVGYNIIKYWKKSAVLRDLFIVVYSYFIYTIFMHPIDSLFYLETFTFYTCGVILFFCIVYGILILTGKKRNIKKTKYDYNDIRILNITPGLNLCGGIESYCMNYYRCLDKEFHVDFLTHEIKDKDYKEEIEKNGDKVFVLNKIGLKRIFKNIKEIDEFFKEHNNYDIVHCHMANAAIFYFYFAKKYNIDVRILHSHQNDYADKLTHKLRNIPLVFFGKKMATVNFACSKQAGDFLFNKKDYYIINNAIDTYKYKYNSEVRKMYRQKLGIENNIVIGHIGRFQKQKNHEFLIDIFNEICHVKDNYTLLLVGDGEDKNKIENKVNDLGLKNKVLFLGSRNDVEKILQAIDIFVLPSLYEGLGIVNIEAQASGVPTIVSDGIPKEAQVTDLLQYIPLSQNQSFWANKIMNTPIDVQRIEYNEKVKKSEYDIHTESIRLMNIYKEVLEFVKEDK